MVGGNIQAEESAGNSGIFKFKPGEDTGYNRDPRLIFGDESLYSEEDPGHIEADKLLKSKNYNPVPIENRRSVEDFKKDFQKVEINKLEDLVEYIQKFAGEFGEALVELDYSKSSDKGVGYNVNAKYQFLDRECSHVMQINTKELGEEPYTTMRGNLVTLIDQENYNVDFNESGDQAYVTPDSKDD